MGSDNNDKMLDSGMPNMSEESKNKSYKFVFILTVIPAVIGLAIAFAIYSFGSTTKFDARIESIVQNDLHWVFAAITVLGRCVALINAYPMVFKSLIMKGNSGNLRSNPFIYKAIGKQPADNVVILDGEGDVGAYNRANRSLHHMVENFAVVLAGLFAAGQIFPFPVFVCVCVFAAGRSLHQIGYTSGYGGHGAGFAISTLATVTIEGLCTLVALKGFGLL